MMKIYVRKAKKAGIAEPLPKDNMSEDYYEMFCNQDIKHDRTKPIYFPGTEHFPINLSGSPPVQERDLPKHSSYQTPTIPMYYPSNIPTYHPSEVQTYHPSAIPPYYPLEVPTYVLPNPHPSYFFLSNKQVKEEPNFDSSDWMQCHSDQRRWHIGTSAVDSINSLPTMKDPPTSTKWGWQCHMKASTYHPWKNQIQRKKKN